MEDPQVRAFAMRAVTESFDNDDLRVDEYHDSVEYEYADAVGTERGSAHIAKRKITIIFRGRG